jgi:hypothetical protein
VRTRIDEYGFDHVFVYKADAPDELRKSALDGIDVYVRVSAQLQAALLTQLPMESLSDLRHDCAKQRWPG